MNDLLERLERNFAVSQVVERQPRLTTLTVDRENAERLIRELRDREGYTHLNFVTCADFIEDGQLRLTYMLTNYDSNNMLGVHVYINREKAEMTSIHTLWAQAWAYQRELREMYGIDFPGSPRIEEDFCLEGWDNIPPLRRDFDTRAYSDEQFGHLERHTEEPRQYMKVQFYPDRGGDAS